MYTHHPAWIMPSLARIARRVIVEDFAADLRNGIRQLRASPAFTGATLLTMALGVGATTAMFGIEHTLTAPSVEVAQSATLVHVGQGAVGDCAACGTIARGTFIDVRNSSRTLADFALVAPWRAILRGAQRTEIVSGAQVTPGFFSMLGIRALIGRTITRADSVDGARDIVVLSEPFWIARFGGDSAIVGRTITLDGRARTVLGVVPRRMAFPENVQVWSPLAFEPGDAANHVLAGDDAFARLRPGVSLAGARAELAVTGRRIVAANDAGMRGLAIDLESFQKWETPNAEDDIPLFVAVGMVLCVACVNLAGLLLARLTARRREIAVRAALGATRGRLARQLLTETLLLTALSGVLGAVVAAAGIRLVRDGMPAFVSEALPRWRTMHLDATALAIALGTSVLTGLVIALWPAMQAAGPQLVETVKNGSRGASGGGSVSRLRRALIVVELALAIVLLSAAGLLARSARNLHRARPGFRADHVLTFRVTAPATSASGERSPQWDHLAAALSMLPDAVRVGAVVGGPYARGAATSAFVVDGNAPVPSARRPIARMTSADPAFFATLEVPIRRGRAFQPTDRDSMPRVAVIDERLAHTVFGASDPLGRSLVIDSVSWRIVGIAAETAPTVRRGFGPRIAGEIYRPLAQVPSRMVQYVVRTRSDPLRLARDAARIVSGVDRDLAVTNVSTLAAAAEDASAPDRVLADAMIGFALAAVLISMIGLYGVVSYLVEQRMREFGIRRALGADAASLFALVLGESGRLTAIGAALGLAGALGAGRVVSAVLVDESAADPLTLGTVIVVMAAIALASTYPPARRAARADPMQALRQE
jgi:predicted permease